MSAATTQPVRAIPARERLIFALDVPDLEGAKKLVARLADAVHFYKIGLELATSPHYFELLRWLIDQDKRVFTDLKLYDIPATVGAAVRQLRNSGASFLTVHGDRAIMEAAAELVRDEGFKIVPEIMIPLVGDWRELKFVREYCIEEAEAVLAQLVQGAQGRKLVEIGRAHV